MVSRECRPPQRDVDVPNTEVGRRVASRRASVCTGSTGGPARRRPTAWAARTPPPPPCPTTCAPFSTASVAATKATPADDRVRAEGQFTLAGRDADNSTSSGQAERVADMLVGRRAQIATSLIIGMLLFAAAAAGIRGWLAQHSLATFHVAATQIAKPPSLLGLSPDCRRVGPSVTACGIEPRTPQDVMDAVRGATTALLGTPAEVTCVQHPARPSTNTSVTVSCSARADKYEHALIVWADTHTVRNCERSTADGSTVTVEVVQPPSINELAGICTTQPSDPSREVPPTGRRRRGGPPPARIRSTSGVPRPPGHPAHSPLRPFTSGRIALPAPPIGSLRHR